MKKRKIKRNVGFSLYSEALPFASTTLGFTPPFLENREVLGKGLQEQVPCGELGTFGFRGTQSLRCGCRGCAVPLLPLCHTTARPGGIFSVCSADFMANTRKLGSVSS